MKENKNSTKKAIKKARKQERKQELDRESDQEKRKNIFLEDNPGWRKETEYYAQGLKI